MTRTQENETFISFGELLHRSARKCTEAGRSLLAHQIDVDAPYQKAMKLVVGEELDLAMKLAGYAEKGRENVVCTRLQYKPQEAELALPDSLDAALDNITQVNRDLVEILRDLEDKSAPGTLCESVDSIRRNVDTVNRRISMIRLTAQDV